MAEEKFIGQTYWTSKSIKVPDIAYKITELMAVREDEFKPTVFYGERFTKRRNEKYESNNASKFIDAMLASDVNYVVLTNSDRKKRDIIFGFTINMLNDFSVVNLNVSHSYFMEDKNLRKYIEIGREIANNISPIYGKIHDIADSNEIMGEEVFNLLEKIPAAFWGNYFGKHYIDKIGREKLLSFKGYIVEELKNGDIYIQTSASPMNPSSLEDRKVQNELAKLIGIKGQGNVFTNTFKGLFGK